jgi:hypothetical protein
MEGGSYSDDILASSTAKVVYFGVLILLMFLLVWQMRGMSSKTERLIGSGIQDQVFTSGATQRRLGQEFSSTNQGDYTIVHNDELKELVPGIIPKKAERLVNDRGNGPDFWEISSELDAYKQSQVAPMQQDASTDSSGSGSSTPSTTEWLARDSVASQVEDQLLRDQLYR